MNVESVTTTFATQTGIDSWFATTIPLEGILITQEQQPKPQSKWIAVASDLSQAQTIEFHFLERNDGYLGFVASNRTTVTFPAAVECP